MADDQPQSLKDFVAMQPRKRGCILCAVPLEIEKQARDGKAAGITYKLIGQWLETIVHEPMTKGRLERHFQDQHVRDDT